MEYDLNKNGIVTGDEMSNAEKLIAIDNADKKEDAQRRMAWFALFGMVCYPLIVLCASLFGHDNSAKILGDMAGTYFVSVAAIVAAFYGKEAFINRQKYSTVIQEKTDPVFDTKIESKPVVRRPNL